MKEVNFLYEEKQKVQTALGESGIITMLGHRAGINQYYVETKHTGNWTDEDQLTPA